MRILFVTGHSFHPDGRKASIHFLASSLRKLGNEVYVLTIGVSLLRIATSPQRSKGTLSYRRWKLDADGLWKRVHIDLLHQPARDRGLASTILRHLSSRRLSPSALKNVGHVDAVVLDSGLAVTYYDHVRRMYPAACVLYNAADSLAGVGYSGRLIEEERHVLANADVVRSPSRALTEAFPPESNVFVVPQGVDKSVLLRKWPSPYPTGSSNAILVGSTLLDWDALIAIAEAVPKTRIHVFGVADRAGPANLVLHGEVSFSHLAPFMQHASYALAPYKISPQSAYIAESSLKVRQYRLCGLPIICPANLAITGSDVFPYDPSDLSTLGDTIGAALARGRRPYPGFLPTWTEVAKQVEKLLSGKGKRTASGAIARATASDAYSPS